MASNTSSEAMNLCGHIWQHGVWYISGGFFIFFFFPPFLPDLDTSTASVKRKCCIVFHGTYRAWVRHIKRDSTKNVPSSRNRILGLALSWLWICDDDGYDPAFNGCVSFGMAVSRRIRNAAFRILWVIDRSMLWTMEFNRLVSMFGRCYIYRVLWKCTLMLLCESINVSLYLLI